MRLDSDQLEWVVREVVRRLHETTLRGQSGGMEPADNDAERKRAPSGSNSHVVLTQSLITTCTLENRLSGITRLSIPKRAVITPAAKDLLKERGITLITI